MTNDTSPDQNVTTSTEVPLSNSSTSDSAKVRKHGLQIIILLVVAIVGVSACLGLLAYYGHRQTNTMPVADTMNIDKVTAILSSDKISGVYPNNQSETSDVHFQSNIFQGLTQIDSSGRASGLLAKQWSNPDTHTWLFDLQPNSVFSNGQPVKASDVVFSINQSIKNGWPGSEQIPLVDQVTATSDRQVKITTKGTDPALLNELEQVFIINEQQYTSKKSDEYPIGSGPYLLESFKSDPNGADEYVLKANSHYYLTKPKVQQINVLVQAPNDTSVDYGIKQDASVIYLTVPTADDKTKLLKAGYQIKNMGSKSVDYIGLDANRAKTPYINLPVNPLSKLSVRQALVKAINTTALAANPPELGLQYANQMVPVSVFGSDPTIKSVTYDPAGAKKQLTEAGYPNGFAMTLDGPSFAEEEAAAVMKDWKDNLNVTVTYNPLDKDTGLVKLQNHDTSAYILGWDYSTYDMAAMFPLLDASDPSNFSAYSNSEATALVNKISTTIDLEQRKTLLQQLQRVILSDAAYIPLWFVPDLYAVKTNIHFPSAAPATWSGM